MIKKTVRIGSVQQQDEFRRQDVMRMSPSERVEALIKLRNRAFAYEPLKRIVHVRKLG